MRRPGRRWEVLVKPSRVIVLILAVVCSCTISLLNTAFAADLLIYGDVLDGDWANWSWDAALDFENSAPVFEGQASLAVTLTGPWAGCYLSAGHGLDARQFEAVDFYLHGGAAAGETLRLVLYDGGFAPGPAVNLGRIAGAWRHFSVPLEDLGGLEQISGIVWQDTSGGSQPVFYLDAIALKASSGTPTPSPTPGQGPWLAVDVQANRNPISPFIYGMNFAPPELAAELRLPVNRWGGNATSRYNWMTDNSNRAADWFFENIANDVPDPGSLPDGSAADKFVEQNLSAGTAPLLTVPLIGWTPRGRDFACGFSVAKYGPQQQTDPWQPDCGNGISPQGQEIDGNDPRDTSDPISPEFVSAWIAHLSERFAPASSGGVPFYCLDNEPMLWNETHRDVRPEPLSYDEIRDLTVAYGAAVKAADPAANTLGPVVWGWTAYFYSAADWDAGGAWWENPQDRNAHGGVPFVEWYLRQMRDYEQAHGVRILDYLDVHFYPQAPGVALSSAGGPQTQALRLRSTRALWDPSYTDESWIGAPVELIPRMRRWVADNYPGTLLAVTEYNWGGLEHINGALAQADALGIFGREKLDLATLWAPPDTGEPGAHAFRMFRNYDGAGSAFGGLSVHAASADQSALAIYAAERTGDGALTVVVINKSNSPSASRLSLAGFAPAAAARTFRYSEANLGAIQRLPDQTIAPDGFNAIYPSRSITLFEILPASAPTATHTPPHTATPTATPTAEPTGNPHINLTLDMPQVFFTPGAACYLNAILTNHGPAELPLLLAAALDIGTGDYWFWPSWTHYPPETDMRQVPVPPGPSLVPLIAPFFWPEGAGSGGQFRFIAALLDLHAAHMVTPMAEFWFSYGTD